MPLSEVELRKRGGKGAVLMLLGARRPSDAAGVGGEAASSAPAPRRRSRASQRSAPYAAEVAAAEVDKRSLLGPDRMVAVLLVRSGDSVMLTVSEAMATSGKIAQSTQSLHVPVKDVPVGRRAAAGVVPSVAASRDEKNLVVTGAVSLPWPGVGS